MRLPTVTPYKNLLEIEQLGRAFLDSSDDEDIDAAHSQPSRGFSSRRSQQKEAALNQVQLLLNRGSCPFAIEATASLCSAVMGDPATVLHPSSAEAARAYDLAKLAYSMALVRFVNGVVDEHQSGLFAESIASLAARAHLPLWLVEIRHAATHQKTPSLPVLREGCAAVSTTCTDGTLAESYLLSDIQALKWLQSYYWRRLAGWVRVSKDHMPLEGQHDPRSTGAHATLLSGSEWHDVINEAEARLECLTRNPAERTHCSAEIENAAKLSFKEVNVHAKLPTGWTRNPSHETRPLGWASTASLPA